MTTVLITGTSRGLGLALTLVISSASSTRLVFATARAPNPPAASQNSLIHQKAKSGLDILINNAAVQIFEPDFITEKSLTQTLTTNVISVHNVTSAFLPLLHLSPTKKIISINSTLGSISLVDTFAAAPVASYKISKAALNMLNAQYAIELGKEGFTCTVISPGWLKTDLGGETADLSVDVGGECDVEDYRGTFEGER